MSTSPPRIIFNHKESPKPDHNLASPVLVTFNGNNMAGEQICLMEVIGGLTKLEQGALQMGAAILARMPFEESETVSLAVSFAESILAECNRRQKAGEPYKAVEDPAPAPAEDTESVDGYIGGDPERRSGGNPPATRNGSPIILPGNDQR